MRQPSPLPELNTVLQLLQHGGLDYRLPGLHPVTAVYYAAAPVLLTLRGVPLAGALPAFAEGVGDMPSPITTAIESLLHLPADLQRLHQYVGIGSTRKLLRDATDASVSLPGHGNAESYCELTYQLGRGFYSDVVRPIDGNAAHEAMLSGELAPIDGDVLRDSWDVVRKPLGKWWNLNAYNKLMIDVKKECERAKRPDEDGPADRKMLAYQGQTYPLKSRSWDVLACLWGNGLVPFSDLGEIVWGDAATKDSTIRSGLSRLGVQLSEHGLPLEVVTHAEKAEIRTV